ncbi:hypothetical protein GGR55DRAFT_695860 [Xylaria sp. FL0064]|nr:hypothetical protein GGR55DRAFT_695860 [Xylaria sp. FL0064]
MSSTSPPAETTIGPESLLLPRTDQDVQESNINFNDLDLLLSSQDLQNDTTLQLPDFSFDASAMEVPTLTEGSLPNTSASNPNLVWDSSLLNHPPVDTSTHFALQILTYHVQSLDTQVRSLDARVQALEALYQRASSTIEDFTKWSEKMEKHCQETNKTVLELFGMVRTVLKDDKTTDGPAKRG